ncbi:MAG: hypothetical protein QOF42_2467 [Gammaproteobacteria bacterium]|nr:hypothetical protein [Gammaproteobacteria bacterium]
MHSPSLPTLGGDTSVGDDGAIAIGRRVVVVNHDLAACRNGSEARRQEGICIVAVTPLEPIEKEVPENQTCCFNELVKKHFHP